MVLILIAIRLEDGLSGASLDAPSVWPLYLRVTMPKYPELGGQFTRQEDAGEQLQSSGRGQQL
jgi:hypothetical protein